MKPNPTAPNRNGLTRLTRWAERLARRSAAGLTVLAALGLSACGSGSRVESFAPDRIVVFGDELSLLTTSGGTATAGRKYTINTVPDTTTGTIDCSQGPMWTQVLGTNFGFGMPDCGGTGNSVMLAANGATVDQIVTQVSGYTGTMDSKTLVTVMGGLHDVLNAYAAYKAGSKTYDETFTQVGDAGRTLGNLVNSIAKGGAGGRVIYVTMPDLGLSPYATVEGQAALLTGLTDKFNEQLRLAVTNDGRFVGLVTSDSLLRTMVSAYNASTTSNTYGLTNVADWACAASATKDDWTSVLSCTNLTLASGAAASTTTYLWADAIHPGPNWQTRVGSAAVTRATNNPF